MGGGAWRCGEDVFACARAVAALHHRPLREGARTAHVRVVAGRVSVSVQGVLDAAVHAHANHATRPIGGPRGEPAPRVFVAAVSGAALLKDQIAFDGLAILRLAPLLERRFGVRVGCAVRAVDALPTSDALLVNEALNLVQLGALVLHSHRKLASRSSLHTRTALDGVLWQQLIVAEDLQLPLAVSHGAGGLEGAKLT